MAKPTLLIVDDIEDNRLGLQDWLEADYACVLAADADEAQEALRQHVPVAILLDLSLPGMDGWELARVLKADQTLRHIPIIAISAYARAEDIERALAAGCDDYVAKPFRMAQLLEVLQRHVGNTHR